MDTLIDLHRSAPEFSLPSLDGEMVKLEQRTAEVLVLNFWSAECPWSKRADEMLLAWLTAWKPRVELWSIASNANESIDLIRKVAKERGLPLVLLDSRQEVADKYAAQTTPQFFVLDKEGILRYRGALDDATFRQREPRRDYLKDAVEALLNGRLPDPADTPPYGCAIVRFAPD